MSVRVTGIRRIKLETPIEVFDITVADNHNFYVTANGTSALVHNCKEFIVAALVGPVVAESKIEALTPTVYLHKTPVEGKKFTAGKASWVYAMQYLANHEARNEQIVAQVMKDLTNGHNIVIPVLYKKHALELKTSINKAFGSYICEMFMGGGGDKNTRARKETLTQAKAGKLRVIVGIRSLLQLGLNVPSWSAIYTVLPISNRPNYKQETSRVCTPKEGKRSPIIRLFVDLNQPQSVGCARTCLKDLKFFKYKFAESEKQRELYLRILERH